MTKEIRWKQRFSNFEKSYKLLEKNITLPLKTDLEKAGIIKLFDISFELAWKVMKDFLEFKGIIANSPREAIKHSFQIDLLDDGHIWLEALSNRNLSVHTYDEDTAKKIIDDIKNLYFPQLKKFYNKLLQAL